MTLPAATVELQARWSEWLLSRNRRGMRGVLWIVLCLYPAFGVLDYLVAPRSALPLLYGTRAAVTLVTLVLFRVLDRELFRRHPNAITASYMVLISFGISLMTVYMGGLGSPYYAGLALVMVASGLLFVWPSRVVAVTYSSIVIIFLVANLAGRGHSDLLTAISNQFFLISTAIIAGTGQMLGYRSQREQVSFQLALEKATQNLAGAHEQLKRLDRFKSEFFANITHELKTPLTLILAPLGLLIDGQLGPTSEPQRSTLASMQKSGVRLSRLISDLLDLSKLEESRLRLRVERHDLVAYLQGLLSQVEPLAQRKSLTLSFESFAPSAFVFCDIDRLERVFVNLLSNATKFTEPGGWVALRLFDEGASLRVEVRDNGVGFPSHLNEEVFQRFFQADMEKKRRFGSAGIGLALAKELVELHGGEIWAASTPGQGATFCVRLVKDREHFDPHVLDRRGTVAEHLGGHREGDHGLGDWQLDTPQRFRLIDVDEATEQRLVDRDLDESQREHSVLVVEDTPDVARVIRLALHHEYRVLVAGDGQQGLELARRYRPSVIITDWMMPRMDGLALTAELRKSPETRNIPIIMLSARSDVEDKIRGLDIGVSAYLGKPFAASEIVSTVRSLMRNQEVAADSLLTQKIDSLETIAGGLAHEILNPLNYLKNALSSVQRDSQSLIDTVKNGSLGAPESGVVQKLDQRMQKMFEVSQAGVKRIANTVDLMVRYSREGYARSARPYDVYAALADVVGVVGPSVARDVSIDLDLVGHGWVSCVPEELNQVLSNLVQNALEAVPNDGTGRVWVKGRNDGAELVLSVCDNGSGIAEAERARIFDAFYTTKQVGHGMGLGLTITRRVIVAMGGALTLKSQLGHGSEFIMRVPSAVELEGERVSPKVLFVDDDESNLLVCEAVCSDEFDVLTAASGALALELMRAHEVAVIVTDQRMPHMSGVELLEQVRIEFPDAARVLVTAYSDAHAAIDAINRGRVRRYLKKPWEPSELKAEIMDGLERYSTQRRIKELERRLIQTERVYALGIVAAGIGHELRNPISWIATNLSHSLSEITELSRALDSRDLGLAASKLEEIRAALQDANVGTERVIEIVSAIQLSMVRPASEAEPCDLDEVVRLALRLVEGDLRRSAHVELDVQTSAWVSGSRTQLSQIIVNLLVNSIHAVSKLPHDKAVVCVRVFADGRLVCLEVADSGPGVPEQDRERIFDPFFTTKPGVGTGLGLAISRKIALDLGGFLEVGRDSRLGGARFRLSLPAHAPRDAS